MYIPADALALIITKPSPRRFVIFLKGEVNTISLLKRKVACHHPGDLLYSVRVNFDTISSHKMKVAECLQSGTSLNRPPLKVVLIARWSLWKYKINRSKKTVSKMVCVFCVSDENFLISIKGFHWSLEKINHLIMELYCSMPADALAHIITRPSYRKFGVTLKDEL